MKNQFWGWILLGIAVDIFILLNWTCCIYRLRPFVKEEVKVKLKDKEREQNYVDSAISIALPPL